MVLVVTSSRPMPISNIAVALAYVSMCRKSEYVTAYRAKYPLDLLARRIAMESGRVPQSHCTRCGRWASRSETGATSAFDARGSPDVNSLLFDISQPLLTTAVPTCNRHVREQSVHTLLVHGNFSISRSTTRPATPAKGRRRRLYTMLGYTLANLDSELRFLSTALRTVSPETCFSSTSNSDRHPLEPANTRFDSKSPLFSASL